MDLTTNIAPQRNGGLSLRNPVMTASGTFGFGVEYAEMIDIQRLGAIVCKTTTRHPRTGNPQPRIAEATAGMINSIGLQNPGVDAVLAEKTPVWAAWEVPVVVNIAGEDPDDFAYLAKRFDGAQGVAALELNLSCPNVAGGLDFSTDPKRTLEVVGKVRDATRLPVIAKLTPNITDIVPIACAAEEAGADAVSLTNTLVGMVMDREARRPMVATRFGGLSGPAIKPVSLAMVYKVAGAVKIPVIGIGGIRTGLDAVDYFLAGASAVQVGTANFLNPNASLDILRELEDYMAEHGMESLKDLIGKGRTT